MSGQRMRIFFDGGCRPNPGMMETAVVLRGEAHLRHDLGMGDSSDAEWLALLQAAELAVSLGLEDVEFVGDSMLVIMQARGEWKCRREALRAHLAAYREKVAGIARVRLRHVARSKNLAGQALQRARTF